VITLVFAMIHVCKGQHESAYLKLREWTERWGFDETINDIMNTCKSQLNVQTASFLSAHSAFIVPAAPDGWCLFHVAASALSLDTAQLVADVVQFAMDNWAKLITLTTLHSREIFEGQLKAFKETKTYNCEVSDHALPQALADVTESTLAIWTPSDPQRPTLIRPTANVDAGQTRVINFLRKLEHYEGFVHTTDCKICESCFPQVSVNGLNSDNLTPSPTPTPAPIPAPDTNSNSNS
jgi:hypothetical protein